MIRYEWKKMLIYRRGILWIILYLAITLINLLYFVKPYDPSIEENRQSYDSYMAILEGTLTDAKKSFIREEEIRLQQSILELQKIRDAYFSGRLSEEEYRSSSLPLEKDEQAWRGFQAIFNQYIYVREKPEERQLLYTNGWNGLLARQSVDYMFMILLVFLLVPVFCEEYQSGMSELLRTESKGASRLPLCKIFVAVATAVIMALAVNLMELGYYGLRYGLPHGEFTLQSLSGFGSAEKTLSLWQAYGLKVLLSLFGYGFAAVILMWISAFVRKYIFCLAIGVAALALPFITVSQRAVFAEVPGPWGYLIGTVYLMGTRYGTNLYTGERRLIFQEISWGKLGGLAAVSLALIGLMVYLVWRKNTNWWVIRKIRKKAGALSLLLVLSLLLGGCRGKTQAGKVIYNSGDCRVAEAGQYIFHDSLGTEEVGTVCEDPQTGESWWLDRNPLIGDREELFLYGDLFSRGKFVYYIKGWRSYEARLPGINAGFNMMAIMEVNTENFSEREVCVQSVNERDEYFMGIRRSDKLKGEFLLDFPGRFFLDGQNAYFQYNNLIYRMDLSTGWAKLLLELPLVCNVAYDGEALYYLGSEYELTKYRISDGTTTVLPGTMARDFRLSEEGIYFLNRRDGDRIYLWDFASSGARKVTDAPAKNIWNENDYLYYEDGKDGGLYQLNKKENKIRLVTDMTPAAVYTFNGADYLYVQYHVPGEDWNSRVTLRVDEVTLTTTTYP